MNQPWPNQQIQPGSGKKVLIVEDDEAMAVALRDGFAYEGYEVLSAQDGISALDMIRAGNPDIVVLDVMLPKINGLDVCRQIRREGGTVPIIMLTARGREIDKVLGLKLGADDYVTKPFSMMELVVRAETILRRVSGHAKTEEKVADVLRFEDVLVDFKKHEAFKNGSPLELTPREFMLLAFFVARRGEVVTRDQLLDGVWGFDHIPYTRTVDTHMAKLRKKIEADPANPKLIVTVHRLGYKFMG